MLTTSIIPLTFTSLLLAENASSSAGFTIQILTIGLGFLSTMATLYFSTRTAERLAASRAAELAAQTKIEALKLQLLVESRAGIILAEHENTRRDNLDALGKIRTAIDKLGTPQPDIKVSLAPEVIS